MDIMKVIIFLVDLEGYSGGVVQKSNNTAILTIESLPKQVNAIEVCKTLSNLVLSILYQ